MSKYKCKNFGSCSLADSGMEFEVALGGDDRCAECGVALATLQGSAPADESGRAGRLVPIAAAVVAVLVAAGGGYAWWRSQQVVVLIPESAQAPSGPVAAPPVLAPAAASAALAVAEIKASEARPSEVNVGETSARVTCDDATRAKSPDMAKVCRRAAAVTLLNSGVQAAIAGNLEQAEKDYVAAKDKDADIPELYFNLAILKARQGKGSEAVDNLTLAASKGFRRFDLLATEPAFVKLRTDPALKAKLDVFPTK